jgi:hypothetical protein
MILNHLGKSKSLSTKTTPEHHCTCWTNQGNMSAAVVVQNTNPHFVLQTAPKEPHKNAKNPMME